MEFRAIVGIDGLKQVVVGIGRDVLVIDFIDRAKDRVAASLDKGFGLAVEEVYDGDLGVLCGIGSPSFIAKDKKTGVI